MEGKKKILNVIFAISENKIGVIDPDNYSDDGLLSYFFNGEVEIKQQSKSSFFVNLDIALCGNPKRTVHGYGNDHTSAIFDLFSKITAFQKAVKLGKFTGF